MTKVLITGTFDIIHPGHLNLIMQAKKLGNFVVAVIARDQNVVKVKGRESYFNEQDRLENLKKLGLVDEVILGDLTDPYKLIMAEKPDVIALGYDQQVFVDQLAVKIKELKLKTKIVRLLPFKEDFCKGKNLRQAIEDEQAGVLLVDKEEDWTSHDVVAKLRGLVKIKQIGHTGTLDPFATGLLLCAVGKATKMVGLFDLLPKTYAAQIKLGVVSDTYDRTGEIKERVTWADKKISTAQLVKVLKTFLGKQQQLPPMYSAKKVGGKKLYVLARQGLEVARKPAQIEIYDLKLLNFQKNILDIEVRCSSGTYIRTLANDLGEKLGTGAVLWELRRTAIGDFSVAKASGLAKISRADWQRLALKPLEALKRINSALL